MTYSLRRTRDNAGDSGPMSMAIVPVYDDSGNIVDVVYEDTARPRVGAIMRVGTMFARSFSAQDWWQTTLITEITDEWKEDDADCVRFNTGNSTYIWKSF
jgi:hypothetical protein